MFLKSFKAYKSYLLLLAAGLFFSPASWAAGPPVPSSLNNPLALTLVTLMVILAIVIAVLGHLLTGLAQVKRENEKKDEQKTKLPVVVTVIGILSLAGQSAFSQDVSSAVQSIGGLTPFVFYSMMAIIFIEMMVVMALLINIKFLIKKDSGKVFEGAWVPKTTKFKVWWNNLNRFKPVEKESEIELDHDYDGIRELDNRLPPWWLYGFYISIFFAVVYLWRYHVSYSAPLSKEEYEISVTKAEEEIKAYLAKQGEAVDENTVTVLTEAPDIAAGKKIYDAVCVACHKADGGGSVGPNLTDDYWLHGGDIKNIFKTIKYGFNAMPPWQASYSNKQLAQIASYVMSLHGSNPPDAKPAEGELYKPQE